MSYMRHFGPPSQPHRPTPPPEPVMPPARPVAAKTKADVPPVIVALAATLALLAIGAVVVAVALANTPQAMTAPVIAVQTAPNSYDLPTTQPTPPVTPAPNSTPTASPVPTATPPFPAFCVNQTTPQPGCGQCPYSLGTETETQAQIIGDLKTAAADYQIPYRLVLAISHNESGWREKIVSCSDDVGLGQIKWIYADSLNALAVPECNLSQTTYDVLSYTGNAHLTAKLIAWLDCYFAYNGGNGGTLSNPAQYTAAWYYYQTHKAFPDLPKNWPARPIGTPTPSLCAAVYQDIKQPYYMDLPSLETAPWSCPFTAKAGDSTVLEVVISAYNEGISSVNTSGITNQSYVDDTLHLIFDLVRDHI